MDILDNKQINIYHVHNIIIFASLSIYMYKHPIYYHTKRLPDLCLYKGHFGNDINSTDLILLLLIEVSFLIWEVQNVF